jgi:uncharacterized membrane protein HdeD (DUF308 family)
MDIKDSFLKSLQSASKKVIFLAVVLIILGILSITLPAYSGMTITVILGVLFIIGGALRTTFAFVTTSWGSAILRFLFGLVMFFGGIWLIMNPEMGMTTLTIVLAVMFIIDGISEVTFSFFLKPVGGGGMMLLNGIIGILLGVLIFAKWPASGEWAIGLLVGIKLVVDGIALLSLGMVGKKTIDAVDK